MARRAVTSQPREILDNIRSAVQEIEPTAQVILYGSRARGDAAPDSDWDILILLDGPVNALREDAITQRLFALREDAITQRLFALQLETDTVLSTIVYSKEDWASSLYQAMPFHENVTREGITL